MSEKDCPRFSDIAVLQNNHSTMAEDIKEIKQDQKEMLTQLSWMKDFITSAFSMHVKEADNKYATKQEHMDNIRKIDELTQTHKNSLIWVITLLTGIVLWLIWLIWWNIDKILK